MMEPTPVLETVPVDTPSIREQTFWPAGIFSLGSAEKRGVEFFNCGLVQRPDGLWLITRRSRWVSGLRFGMNDLVAFLLIGRQPTKGFRINMENRWPDEQFEDPRALYHAGKTYVSCCDFVWTNRGWTGAHQIISEVSDDWRSVRRYDPPWAKNGGNTGSNRGHEKNWVWFFHEGLPHMVYSIHPHCVVRFTEGFDPINCWFTPNEIPWEHGEARGGTPPVLVDNEYWTFFHSSTQWTPRRKQYHMGAYAFEARHPFRITRMTCFPLLSGSAHDRNSDNKPLVVFPNGAVLRDGRWFVVFGVNDLNCGWVEIPRQDLIERMFPM
jgi:predicted GH43/DUF377 family glycosyl hydrolase